MTTQTKVDRRDVGFFDVSIVYQLRMIATGLLGMPYRYILEADHIDGYVEAGHTVQQAFDTMESCEMWR